MVEGSHPPLARAHTRPGRQEPAPQPGPAPPCSSRPDSPLSIRAPVPGRAGPARDRGRGGPTRSHPEPGRDTPQRQRVLRLRPWETRPSRADPTRHRPARAPRDGAAAARRAHNPKVGGSNPPPATTDTSAPPPRRGGASSLRPPTPPGAPSGEPHLAAPRHRPVWDDFRASTGKPRCTIPHRRHSPPRRRNVAA